MCLFRYIKFKLLITQISKVRMAQIARFVVTSGLSFTLSTSLFAYFEKGGLSGWGARALGMGGSFTALADDGLAAYYNPAGLSRIYNFEFLLSNNFISQSNRMENFLSGQIPFYRYGTLAFSYWQNQYKNVNSKETIFITSYALPLTANLSLGANLKHLTVSAPLGYTSKGQGVDFGFFYQYPRWKTNFGLLIQDLNTKLDWGNGYFEEIPRMYKLGVAWSGVKKFVFVYDLDILDRGWQHRLGSEWKLSEYLSLRLGYTKFLKEGSSIVLGIGLNYKDWFLDYAYSGIGQEKPNHYLSFGYKIGKSKPLIFAADLTPEKTFFAPSLEKKGLTFNFKGQGAIFWQLDILDRDTSVRSFMGSRIPGKLIWDGKDETGKPLPDGEYAYRLYAEDRKGEIITHEGKINVDQTKPNISLDLSSKEISPDEDKINDAVTIKLLAMDNYKLQLWNFKIVTKEGALVKELKGEDNVTTEFIWDGKDDYYQATVKAGEYACVLKAEDQAGNKSEQIEPITVAFAPVVREVIKEVIKEVPAGAPEGAGAPKEVSPAELKITLKGTVLFDMNSAVLTPSGLRTLERMAIAEVLLMYPLERSNIEGHAEPSERDAPGLAKKRAETVFEHLRKKYDIVAERLTVASFGAEKPVADNRTAEGRAQNRRVEVTIIEK